MWRSVVLPRTAAFIIGVGLGWQAVNLCRDVLMRLYAVYTYLGISSCSNDVVERLLIVGLSVSPFIIYIVVDSLSGVTGLVSGIISGIVYYNIVFSRNTKVNIFHRNYHVQYWYNSSEVSLKSVYDRVYAEFEYDRADDHDDITLTFETGYSGSLLSIETMTLSSLFNSDIYNLNQKSFDFFGFKTMTVFLQISHGTAKIVEAADAKKRASANTSPSADSSGLAPSPTLKARLMSSFMAAGSFNERRNERRDKGRVLGLGSLTNSPSKLGSSIRSIFKSGLKAPTSGKGGSVPATRHSLTHIDLNDALHRSKEDAQGALGGQETLYSFKEVEEAERSGSNFVTMRRASSFHILLGAKDGSPNSNSTGKGKPLSPALKKKLAIEHTTYSGEQREVLYEPPDGTKYIEYFMNHMLSQTTSNELLVSGIPSNILRKFYSIAVRQVLQQCFKLIFTMNGKPILGHHLEVEILEDCHEHSEYLDMMPDIDREAIKSLVSVLLEDKAINLSWLPDNVEARLYENIIVIMFYVMNCFFKTSSFNIIGHTIEAVLKKSGTGLERLSTNISQQIRQIDDSLLEEHVAELMQNHSFGKEEGDSWLSNALGKSIYKTMCALALCIVDQVLMDMKVRFLGDACVYHLVPGPMPPNPHPMSGPPSRAARR